LKYIYVLILIIFHSILYSQTSIEDSMVQNFIYKIQNAIMNNEPSVINSLTDFDKLAERTFHNIIMDENDFDSFKEEFTYCQRIADLVKISGHYTAINYSIIGDTITALFRFVSDEGLNYHEYLIYHKSDIFKKDDFKIIDIYILISGQYISETFRQIFEPLKLQDESFYGKIKNILSKFFGEKKEHIDDLTNFNLLLNEFVNGNYQKAYDIYNSLSDKFRKTKSVQLTNIQVVQYLNENLFVKYTNQYRNNFPNDVGLDLILIDYFLTKNDYIEALNCIQNLENYSPNDGYLQYLKSFIYSMKGDKNNYIKYANLSIKLEPWLPEPYYSLIEFYLPLKQYSNVIGLMDKAEVNAGIIYDNNFLKENEVFHDFIKSSEYKKWRKLK